MIEFQAILGMPENFTIGPTAELVGDRSILRHDDLARKKSPLCLRHSRALLAGIQALDSKRCPSVLWMPDTPCPQSGGAPGESIRA
jgi:hypothetical protein